MEKERGLERQIQEAKQKAEEFSRALQRNKYSLGDTLRTHNVRDDMPARAAEDSKAMVEQLERELSALVYDRAGRAQVQNHSRTDAVSPSSSLMRPQGSSYPVDTASYVFQEQLEHDSPAGHSAQFYAKADRSRLHHTQSASIASELGVLQANMEHQNLEIASLKLRLEGALSREQTLKDELIELKSAWREVEAQLDVRTRQLKDLEDAQHERDHSDSALNAQFSSLETQIKSTQAELRLARSNLERATTRNMLLEQQLSVKQESERVLEDRCKKMEERCTALQKHLEGAHISASNHESKSLALEMNVESLSRKCQTLEQQLQASLETYASSRKQIEELFHENAKLQNMLLGHRYAEPSSTRMNGAHVEGAEFSPYKKEITEGMLEHHSQLVARDRKQQTSGTQSKTRIAELANTLQEQERANQELRQALYGLACDDNVDMQDEVHETEHNSEWFEKIEHQYDQLNSLLKSHTETQDQIQAHLDSLQHTREAASQSSSISEQMRQSGSSPRRTASTSIHTQSPDDVHGNRRARTVQRSPDYPPPATGQQDRESHSALEDTTHTQGRDYFHCRRTEGILHEHRQATHKEADTVPRHEFGSEDAVETDERIMHERQHQQNMPQVIGSSMETVFSSMKHSTEMDLNGFHRSGGGSKSDTFRTLLNGTREETETDVRDAIHEAFLNNHVMRTYARSDERSSRPASAPAKPGGRGKLKLTSHKKRQVSQVTDAYPSLALPQVTVISRDRNFKQGTPRSEDVVRRVAPDVRGGADSGRAASRSRNAHMRSHTLKDVSSAYAHTQSSVDKLKSSQRSGPPAWWR